MTSAIHVRDLRKTYPGRTPVEALRGLDLDVESGSCFGLLGPNGAGKTTTIEILEGLLEPTSGDVEVLGMRWDRDATRLRERIGVTLQETKFTDKLSVLETLQMFRAFFPRGVAAQEAIELVGLGEKSASYVVTLSGGQRQRLAVACALVGEPDLLFLDEPTTGLDPQSRRQLWDVVRSLRARGKTILLTTHYMDEAEKLCDQIAIVDHGRVIAAGSPAELIRSLGGDHVVEFAFGGDIEAAAELDALKALPSVRSARGEADGFQLTVAEPHIALPAILERSKSHGATLTRLSTRHASLEDVFVALTGRHLRDE